MANTGTGGSAGAAGTSGAAGPSICPTLLYRDAKAAIRQLTEAFGFTTVHVYEDDEGRVLHAELRYGNGLVMLGSKDREGGFAKAMADAGPAAAYVVVQDVDAHFQRAGEHGVEILMEPTDQDYGSRDYMARDREGNVWSFGTYVPGVGAEEG
ncbi:VOC family protein [Streptomyces sp. LX-29]|uniref:VOC family protein n=1 Tax=Streptomyces sp. LX-29 TaxID=2900152 RepID=UPI00240D1DDF|nr:VOC family protein [Streptomyces sp. LX-29]WFB10192.1 VOC family protein [Streptomyces sp. LX-29]